MEHKYFLIINGQQSGPFSYHELLSAGLTPDTPVWRAGLDNWVKASTVSELAGLFQTTTTPPPTNPTSAYPPYQNYYGAPVPNGLPVAHTNWLPWAIVGTILGFLCCMIGMIFGILGIVNANKANKFYDQGNAVMGDGANTSARTFTIIALVLGALGIPTSIYLLSNSFASILGIV